uniref:Protein kinase domain-containing protein n=1 Tax=Plectus sambesii TaxID=2011161 RepID=A0A914VUE4_9BILA
MVIQHAEQKYLPKLDDLLHSEFEEADNSNFLSPRNPMAIPSNNGRRSSLNGFRSTPPSSNFHDLYIFDQPRIVKMALDTQSNIEWMPEYMEKLEEIGRGSFGTVHKCHDTKHKRFFVSKEINTRNFMHKDVAKNEIDILKDLNHPHIVSYHGAAINQDLIVIFLEYMSGSSLLQNLKQRGPLTEESVVKCSIQVAQGLEYIHSKDIVHIDIKCENLLLDFNHDNVKICDFGCAIRKVSNGRIAYFDAFDARIGVSAHWTAPEILTFEEFDQSADIWSAGCTIVEMLTCKPPYSRLSEDDVRASVEGRTLSYDPNDLIPSASDSMKMLLTELLQIERDKRLQSGSEVVQKFRDIFPQ